MIYAKINCSDRLPKEDGFYFTNKGHTRLYVLSGGVKSPEWAEPVTWWLEPVAPGMTLQECKDKIAVQRGYLDWQHLTDLSFSIQGFPHKAIDEAAELYMASATAAARQEIEAYKEADEDKKRLCREIDVILCGENAAEQPSLCDILKTVEDKVQEIEKLKEDLKRESECVDHIKEVADETQQQAEALAEALEEAELQIQYLHDKFKETATGNTTLSKIQSALSSFRGEGKGE